jgi:tRNA nucleotidyltransferase (CCA-adding enzyme)
MSSNRWEHFAHQADIGVRGIGASLEEAFEQAALALTSVVTEVEALQPKELVTVTCQAPSDELLFVDWLNAIVYEMATRKMLFGSFEVHLHDNSLHGRLLGQAVDVARHQPAVEVKGATYTELAVKHNQDGSWTAQCVVDV